MYTGTDTQIDTNGNFNYMYTIYMYIYTLYMQNVCTLACTECTYVHVHMYIF